MWAEVVQAPVQNLFCLLKNWLWKSQITPPPKYIWWEKDRIFFLYHLLIFHRPFYSYNALISARVGAGIGCARTRAELILFAQKLALEKPNNPTSEIYMMGKRPDFFPLPRFDFSSSVLQL